VIADNLEDPETVHLQRRFTTFSLKPDTAAKELLWEIALVLPEKSAPASRFENQSSAMPQRV
jgi:hypothetical protein